MTNADYIRQMSDEELIELLVWGTDVPSCDEGCEYESWGCASDCPHERRERAVTEWLSKEVE